MRSVGVSFRETFNLHFPFIFQLCRTNETCPPEADYAEFVRMARNILAGEVFDVVGRNLTIQPGTLRGAPMSLNLQHLKSTLGRVAPGIVLSALVFLAAAPRARADDWGDCNRRIAYAQWQLHEAIEDHGYDSRQARLTRHTRDKNTFATDIATNSGENVNGAKDVTTTASIIVATGMMIEQ